MKLFNWLKRKPKIGMEYFVNQKINRLEKESNDIKMTLLRILQEMKRLREINEDLKEELKGLKKNR